MAQGYTGYTIFTPDVTIRDSANLDAFSRLRVSNPLTSFNGQFTYDLLPLVYQSITSGGGAVTHDTANRCADIALTAAVASDSAYMQTYEYWPYQPGKSQLVFVTFNMQSQAAGATKFAGYSDGINGIEFQATSTDLQFVNYSATSAGSSTVLQANWNLDKLNGSGSSGITLDISKTQILVIDLQALYVGRVRIGFDIGGSIVYAHEFLHANIFTSPYIQYASLPVRCGMIATGAVTTTMEFICSSVISEGGSDDDVRFGYNFAVQSGLISVAVTPTVTHMLSIRPRLTFNGIVNRVKLTLVDIEIYNSGNQPIYWELVIGQALTAPVYTDVNTTHSSIEYTTGATMSGSPTVIIDSGYAASSGSTKADVTATIAARYPLTLNAAGAHRDNGTLTLRAYSLSGSQNCYGIIKYKEIR